ncbi:hypothetical protein COY27_02560 [Candidatus Woesearchaeota archaeon CG_4_10_14_0_2_um_filter_33_13]|nr:MAG: hypothetical protein COY27_02560 [Candidatus Woesearchaeota archaeon CG_4_10_14_0_2_um_filter_33_13]
MQIAENATKVKIPLQETAENLWEYYKFLVENITNGIITVEALNAYQSHSQLPDKYREQLSLSEFANCTGYSRGKITGAFNYVNLHGDIKRMVNEGTLNYAFATQLGRISDKAEQRTLLKRVLEGQKEPLNPNAVRSSEELGLLITKYLQEKESDHQTLVLVGGVVRNQDTRKRDLIQLIGSCDKTLSTLATLITIDPSLRLSTNRFIGDTTTLQDYLFSAQEATAIVEGVLITMPRYEEMIKRVNYRARSLKDRIISGEFDQTVAELKDPLGKAEYLVVPLDLILPDLKQPRKTFTSEELDKLSRSIKKVGLLSPPLLRPQADGTYTIVVGHRRTAASRLAGLGQIGVLIADLTDAQARQIQYEEDIFERVNITERAEKLYRHYLLKKERFGEGYTLGAFAKEHKELGVDTVMKAVLFASLPPEVKQMQQKGLLPYSTAIIIGEEYGRLDQSKDGKNLPDRSDWIIDQAIGASLLETKGSEFRRRLQLARTHLSFEDVDPDIFGGRELIKRCRGYIACEKTRDLVEVIRQLPQRNGLIKEGDVAIAVIRLLKTYQQTIEVVSKAS